jgi:hypothetical protein
MKKCSKCDLTLSVDNFYTVRRKDRPNSYLSSACKECINNATRTKRKRAGDAYLKKEAERKRNAYHKNKQRHCEKNREKHLWLNYGMTIDDYERLLSWQDNRCAICTSEFSSPATTHVDHDHSTGHVRGILCHHCNTGIGLFKDSIENLTNAISYLTDSESQDMLRMRHRQEVHSNDR